MEISVIHDSVKVNIPFQLTSKIKMKYFLCLLILPIILASEFESDALPEVNEDLAAVGSSFDAEVSMTESKVKRAPCYGTQCGNYCIPNIRNGICCPNSRNACPRGTRCCGNPYYVRPWCCKSFQRCSNQINMCLN